MRSNHLTSQTGCCDIHLHVRPAQVTPGVTLGRCMWSATWMLRPGNNSGSWTEWTESLVARWTCGGPSLLLYRPPCSSLLLSPYVRFIFGTYSWGEYEQPSGCQTLGHTLKNGSGGSGLFQRHQLHMGKSTCSQSSGRLCGVYHRLNASVALFSLRLKEHLAALESAHDGFYPQSSVKANGTAIRPACRQSSLLCVLIFWKWLLNFSPEYNRYTSAISSMGVVNRIYGSSLPFF